QDDLRQNRARRALRLIDGNPVEIQTAHTIGILSAVETDHGPVVREGDTELGLVDLAAYIQKGRCIVLEILPRYVLGLDEERSEIAVTRRRVFPWILDSLADQLVDARNGLACAAMTHTDGKTLCRLVIG